MRNQILECGPYMISKVLKNGRYKLELVARAYGKAIYAAVQSTKPWRSKLTPYECAAFFGYPPDETTTEVLSTPASDGEEFGRRRQGFRRGRVRERRRFDVCRTVKFN